MEIGTLPHCLPLDRSATALILLVAITQGAISPVLTAAHAVRTGENVKRTFGERYYSAAEIAQGLRISIKTVRRWYTQDRLPVTRVGTLVRIYGPDLNHFLILNGRAGLQRPVSKPHRPVAR